MVGNRSKIPESVYFRAHRQPWAGCRSEPGRSGAMSGITDVPFRRLAEGLGAVL